MRRPPSRRPRDDAGPPDLPKETVDVPAIAVTGRTIHVPANGNLQKAIDDAKPGDAITLAPGATYRGNFQLRRKDGNGWIVIGSAASDLPAPGTRVNPSDASKMPKIVADSGYWVFKAEPGAHHYRLVGLEIAPADGKSLTNLVELGGGDERGVEALPHHIIIERCYLHGDRKAGARRGVSLNAAHVAVVDSYLSDFKERTTDAQAVSGWNGPGPFLIEGNYLEASGENIMFGGGDPSIPNLVPSDIVITRNHMSKPLRWKKDDPSFEGTEWAVKNLFELKNARRVLVDGNLLEYNWPQAQNGFAILFTVRNQDGGAPWSVVEDVTFSNNVIRHVAAGINILGRDDNHRASRRSALRFATTCSWTWAAPGALAGCSSCSRAPTASPSSTTPRSRPEACSSAAITLPHRVRLRRERGASQRVWDYRFRYGSRQRHAGQVLPRRGVPGQRARGRKPHKLPAKQQFSCLACRHRRDATSAWRKACPAPADVTRLDRTRRH